SINQLAEEFCISSRTVRRDITERLVDLDWKDTGPDYYSLEKKALGRLYKDDIERFAHFASIQNLFPKDHRDFFMDKLVQSIHIKGHNYEDLSHKSHEFNMIQSAIEKCQYINFSYLKNNGEAHKNYKIAPYILLNRNGIWYLVGLDHGQTKTFCFSQIEKLGILSEAFIVDQAILEDIKNTDSIYYGNQLAEVLVHVDAEKAIYFKRRDLLPNQTIVEEKENGDLIVKSERVNQQEILSLMRYWIPNVRILAPEGLQEELNDSLREYLENL
ncbi:MAG: helix-turn-helix transcriptional regulator, partial [Wohlfahrtiimonas sp.]